MDKAREGQFHRSDARRLPNPFSHFYFSKHGGAVAELHLLVGYACRLLGQDETRGLRLYPMPVDSPAEILEAAYIDLPDASVISRDGPAALRYRELPAFLAREGAKGMERQIRDSLPKALAAKVLFDASTGSESWPG